MSSPPIQPKPHQKLVIIRRKTTVVTEEEVPVVMDCDKKVGFIYEIYNDVNDLVYVGSTINMEKRFRSHKSDSLWKTSKFYAAVRDIGFENFHMRCLEEFRYTEDNELVKKEFEHMAEYDKEMLYNTDTEYGLRSDEARAKISAGFTDDVKVKMSASHLGKTHTDETKAKISASNLGKKMTDEAKAKMSASKLGKPTKPHTDGTKDKMSKAKQKGGSIVVRDNRLEYCYRKDGRRKSKSFSFGPLSTITQEQAMLRALAYQRETFPALFDTDTDEETNNEDEEGQPSE